MRAGAWEVNSASVVAVKLEPAGRTGQTVKLHAGSGREPFLVFVVVAALGGEVLIEVARVHRD